MNPDRAEACKRYCLTRCRGLAHKMGGPTPLDIHLNIYGLIAYTFEGMLPRLLRARLQDHRAPAPATAAEHPPTSMTSD